MAGPAVNSPTTTTWNNNPSPSSSSRGSLSPTQQQHRHRNDFAVLGQTTIPLLVLLRFLILVGILVTLGTIFFAFKPPSYDCYYYDNAMVMMDPPETPPLPGERPTTSTTTMNVRKGQQNSNHQQQQRQERQEFVNLFAPYKEFHTMEEWRKQTENKCYAALKAIGNPETGGRTAWDLKENIDAFILSQLHLPSPQPLEQQEEEISSNNNNEEHREEGDYYYYEPEGCQNAFFDLGTNVGDTIGYYIEDALDVCTSIWLDEETVGKYYWETWYPRPRLDIHTLKFGTWGKPYNPTNHFIHNTKRLQIQPENTCVYGVEGNPRFTQRLERYEKFLKGIHPRPFQHLHIHTETVITKTNGPTSLFLDESSVEKNFWGSSVVGSLLDAQKTTTENGGKAKVANVTGLSLGTLIRKTMAPYASSNNNDAKSGGGGNLIVKMDIEGAEYDVLREVHETGILCDYIAKKNSVILLIEFHGKDVILDEKEFQTLHEGTRERIQNLKDCGVQFENLDPVWS